MTPSIGRRPLLFGALAAGAGLAAPGVLAGPADAATSTGNTTPARQLAFLNHTYTVLDRVTADAVAESAYLREFGNFQLRTTTNGQMTYTGRYLLGRETYLEMFGPGDLPAPDDQAGASGLAVSPDHAGDIELVRDRMVALGVSTPFDAVQTKLIDGDPVPWFRVISASETYAACYPWVMEYVESYFADPRTHSEPASFPGDVSRERYDDDGYRNHLLRDVVGVEIAMPTTDVATVALTLRAAGFTVRQRGGRTVAVGRNTGIVLDTADRAASGWRRIVFALGGVPVTRHVERIGHSTLVVGPGPQAVWSFD